MKCRATRAACGSVWVDVNVHFGSKTNKIIRGSPRGRLGRQGRRGGPPPPPPIDKYTTSIRTKERKGPETATWRRRTRSSFTGGGGFIGGESGPKGVLLAEGHKDITGRSIIKPAEGTGPTRSAGPAISRRILTGSGGLAGGFSAGCDQGCTNPRPRTGAGQWDHREEKQGPCAC